MTPQTKTSINSIRVPLIAPVTAVWKARAQQIEILRQRMFELCPEFYGLSEATIHSPSRAPSRGSPHFRRLRAAICSYLDAEMGRIKQ
jgi:hypothetical protein